MFLLRTLRKRNSRGSAEKDLFNTNLGGLGWGGGGTPDFK